MKLREVRQNAQYLFCYTKGTKTMPYVAKCESFNQDERSVPKCNKTV